MPNFSNGILLLLLLIYSASSFSGGTIYLSFEAGTKKEAYGPLFSYIDQFKSLNLNRLII